MLCKQRGALYLAAILGLLATLIFGTGALSAQVQGTASITSPANGATLTGSVTVQGTATANNFQFYKLEFAPSATPDNVSVIGALVTTPVTSGALGTWNTTQVPDGQYVLRLTVVDNTGNFISNSVNVTVANAGPPPAPEPPRRGCLACHVRVMPNGAFTLGFEAAAATAAEGRTHPTRSPSGVSITPQDQTGPEPCLECHRPGTGDRAARGLLAPLSLRDIVHPAHLFSPIFLEEFTGNCFSCHNVSGTGVFDVLGQAVQGDRHGIPNTVPIPGLLPPS